MLQAILADSARGFWLPQRASTVAEGHDLLFNVILWICIFFFALVTVLLVVLVIKYRHRPGVTRDTAAGHSMFLEITWTLIPTIIVVFLYYYGFRQFMRLAVEPPNAYEITATGQMWQWTFTYPNGTDSSELHVPVNVPVRVILQSNDVIHSLSIPAFRVKKDVVPGRFNRLWFEATEPGRFDIYCAGYCGTGHSQMRAIAVIHNSQADFDQWLKETTEKANTGTPAEMGRKLYQTKGCMQCHSIDGSRITGPTWKDMFGAMQPMSDGTKVLADEAYVMESIRAPLAKIHEGYPPVMPPFAADQVKDSDVKNLIAFMQSISVNFKGSVTNPTAPKVPTTGPTTVPATAPTTAPDKEAAQK